MELQIRTQRGITIYLSKHLKLKLVMTPNMDKAAEKLADSQHGEI
jgi:hypothetical protein